MKWRFSVLLLLGACSTPGSMAEVDPVQCDIPSTVTPLDVAPAPQPGAQLPPDTAPAVQSPYRLTLNLPAYRVDVWRDAHLVHSIPVAVGSRKYRTPRGNYLIRTITWNPWWIPPPSDWARKDKRTPPGPRNPMGKVKLNYSDYYYLHGTPDSGSIGRAASHGCVRLRNQDAVSLALLLQREGIVKLTDEEQQSLLEEWQETRTVALESPLPLEVRYDLVELRDSTLLVHEDIYRLDYADRYQTALNTLQQGGLDMARIDSSALRKFVKQADDDGGERAIHDLLKGEPH